MKMECVSSANRRVWEIFNEELLTINDLAQTIPIN